MFLNMSEKGFLEGAGSMATIRETNFREHKARFFSFKNIRKREL